MRVLRATAVWSGELRNAKWAHFDFDLTGRSDSADCKLKKDGGLKRRSCPPNPLQPALWPHESSRDSGHSLALKAELYLPSRNLAWNRTTEIKILKAHFQTTKVCRFVGNPPTIEKPLLSILSHSLKLTTEVLWRRDSQGCLDESRCRALIIRFSRD